MNTTNTTNPGKKPDGKPAATPTNSNPDTAEHTHDGKVVSISGNKLVSTCAEGKQHSHTVASDAKVSCDGATCRPEDLKAGSKIRVTTKHGDKHLATKVESLQKNAEFAKQH